MLSIPPRCVHGTSEYINCSITATIFVDSSPSILLFIENWLKKGFEDPELTCSSKIREFVRSVSGSEMMETKAREIECLVDDPDYVGQRALFNEIVNPIFLGPPSQSRKLSSLTAGLCSMSLRLHTVRCGKCPN